eukprot:4168921-Prymnesium_polylepis.1
MSNDAICGTVMRSDVGLSTVICLALITPSLAASQPLGCAVTDMRPRASSSPAARPDSPLTHASAVSVTSISHSVSE